MSSLVSIIIPTYNRAHLICDTLESIFQQTYTNWECIIVDDGSFDNTEKLVHQYIAKDSRFKYCKRPINKPKGANACRNYGFKLSKGKYINWFDSDDVMMENKLKLQVEQLKTNTGLDFSICQSILFDLEKNISIGYRGKLVLSNNRFEDYILYKIFWLTTAPLWKRSFIEENSLEFDEGLQQSQEYDFHIKALSISQKYDVLDIPLVKIIMHKDSISHEWKKNTSKVTSNIKVKLDVFLNYSERLSPRTKLKLLEMLTLLFKDLLVDKSYSDAKKALMSLKTGLHYVDISIVRKLLFLFKANLMYLSYRYLGRGYSILKPIT